MPVALNNVHDFFFRISKGRYLHSDDITEVKAKSSVLPWLIFKVFLYFISYMVKRNTFVGNHCKAVVSFPSENTSF